MTVQLIHVQVRTTHTVSKRPKNDLGKTHYAEKNRQKQNGLILLLLHDCMKAECYLNCHAQFVHTEMI